MNTPSWPKSGLDTLLEGVNVFLWAWLLFSFSDMAMSPSFRGQQLRHSNLTRCINPFLLFVLPRHPSGLSILLPAISLFRWNPDTICPLTCRDGNPYYNKRGGKTPTPARWRSICCNHEDPQISAVVLHAKHPQTLNLTSVRTTCTPGILPLLLLELKGLNGIQSFMTPSSLQGWKTLRSVSGLRQRGSVR